MKISPYLRIKAVKSLINFDQKLPAVRARKQTSFLEKLVNNLPEEKRLRNTAGTAEKVCPRTQIRKKILKIILIPPKLFERPSFIKILQTNFSIIDNIIM